MGYLPDLLERVADPLQAPPDRPRYFLLDFPGPPRSPGTVIINAAFRARRQMKQQIVVQILEHPVKVVRFTSRGLDSTYLSAVVEKWQRFDTIGQIYEIHASLRRRREGRRARGEQCGGDYASTAHGSRCTAAELSAAVCNSLVVAREVLRAASNDSAHRECMREGTKASLKAPFACAAKGASGM